MQRLVCDFSEKKLRMVKLWDLSGWTVRATAPEGNLTQGEIVFESILLPNGSRSLTFKTGFGVSILYSLQLALGFNIEVVTSTGWATQYPNKSWFGMAQQIIDGEADLSLAKTSILPNRAEALGYLSPTHGLGLYAFFVQPASKAGRNIFLDPFTLTLWLCLLSVYVIISATVVSIFVIASIAKMKLPPQDKTFISEVLIWKVHTICQHGFHSPPTLSSLRIVLLCGISLGLLTFVSYSAHLISMFASTTVPIKNIEDLLASPIHVLMDQNNQRALNMIQSLETDPVSEKLRSHLRTQKKTMATAAESGKFLFQSESDAFIAFKDTFYTTIKNTYGTSDEGFCQRVAMVSVSGATFKSGLFVKKGSPLKEPFNVKMISMYNSGLMKRYVDSYEATYTPMCKAQGDRSGNSAPPSISMVDVIFIFYFLLLGAALSLILLTWEWAWPLIKTKLQGGWLQKTKVKGFKNDQDDDSQVYQQKFLEFYYTYGGNY